MFKIIILLFQNFENINKKFKYMNIFSKKEKRRETSLI